MKTAEREPELAIIYRSIHVGDAILNDDGYYVFFPDTSRSGYWTADTLRHVADVLDAMNREWNEQVNRDMEHDVAEACRFVCGVRLGTGT